MPDDLKHKQADLIPFNDNIPQMDSCSSQTNKQIELAQNVSFFILIDRCHDFPSDPYLFIDIMLTPQIIRTLVEIGPCQRGFNSNNYVFEENVSGKKFSPNWYNKNVKSGMSCKRNWLVFSPKANKMFCFPCFLFRSVSQYSYQWFNPNKGVSNFRNGNEKIIKHEKSKDHRDAENEYLILKSRILKDITIQQNVMKV